MRSFNLLQNAAQKALVIHARDKWAFLSWDLGTGVRLL